MLNGSIEFECSMFGMTFQMLPSMWIIIATSKKRKEILEPFWYNFFCPVVPFLVLNPTLSLRLDVIWYIFEKSIHDPAAHYVLRSIGIFIESPAIFSVTWCIEDDMIIFFNEREEDTMVRDLLLGKR